MVSTLPVSSVPALPASLPAVIFPRVPVRSHSSFWRTLCLPSGRVRHPSSTNWSARSRNSILPYSLRKKSAKTGSWKIIWTPSTLVRIHLVWQWLRSDILEKMSQNWRSLNVLFWQPSHRIRPGLIRSPTRRKMRSAHESIKQYAGSGIYQPEWVWRRLWQITVTTGSS